MFDEVMKVINAGGYDLTDLLRRIDVLYTNGKLSEDEYNDLIDAARERADADASKGDDHDRIIRLESELMALTDRVTALEADGSTPEPSPTVSEYDPNYWYKKGEQCIWNGKIYEWNKDGSLGETLGVWSPGAYPAGWTLIGDAPVTESDDVWADVDTGQEA